MACALLAIDCSYRKEDQMLKESTTFSTIRTPASYPASQKRYVQGSRADLRVPYREIALSPTRHADPTEDDNPPLPVYDISGPCTDPEVRIELDGGLPELRRDWIKERGSSFRPEFRICPHVRR